MTRQELLTGRDSRVHRCVCGGWRYGTRLCATCAVQAERIAGS